MVSLTALIFSTTGQYALGCSCAHTSPRCASPVLIASLVLRGIQKKRDQQGKECLLKSSRKIALMVALAARSLPSSACGARKGTHSSGFNLTKYWRFAQDTGSGHVPHVIRDGFLGPEAPPVGPILALGYCKEHLYVSLSVKKTDSANKFFGRDIKGVFLLFVFFFFRLTY
ncbi:hypothetical protein F5H01DRAFT_72142 [Linnemannia elongata]|nr:hypothetical protein F5H01DRAFT_72142 [Linnemannia elongata]